jgi:DHA2 family lincomycin resistance protein-like MFS transporter
MNITEIMETEPYTCGTSATVGDVIRQLLDVQVSGIPIVDEKMRPVGFVSDIDLIRFIAHNRPKVYDWGEHMPVIIDDDPIEEKLRNLLDVPVTEIAKSKVVCVESDWDIDEIADYFKQEKVRKMAVLEQGRLIGVITRSTVLRHLLNQVLPDETTE